MRRRKRPRASLKSPETIEGILTRAGEDRFAKSKLPIPLHVWTSAVGARIAARARPVSLERGVLLVRVATSAWASELSLLSPQLRARLAERRIDVKELVFRVGALDPLGDQKPRLAKKTVTLPGPLPPELAERLDAVTDLELRAAIERAARASLARQDTEPPAQRSEARRSSPSRR